MFTILHFGYDVPYLINLFSRIWKEPWLTNMSELTAPSTRWTCWPQPPERSKSGNSSRRNSSETSWLRWEGNVQSSKINILATEILFKGTLARTVSPLVFFMDLLYMGACREPAVSLHSQLHWSSGPPVCFPSWGTQVQSPGGTYVKRGFYC